MKAHSDGSHVGFFYRKQIQRTVVRRINHLKRREVLYDREWGAI